MTYAANLWLEGSNAFYARENIKYLNKKRKNSIFSWIQKFGTNFLPRLYVYQLGRKQYNTKVTFLMRGRGQKQDKVAPVMYSDNLQFELVHFTDTMLT